MQPLAAKTAAAMRTLNYWAVLSLGCLKFWVNVQLINDDSA